MSKNSLKHLENIVSLNWTLYHKNNHSWKPIEFSILITRRIICSHEKPWCVSFSPGVIYQTNTDKRIFVSEHSGLVQQFSRKFMQENYSPPSWAKRKSLFRIWSSDTSLSFLFFINSDRAKLVVVKCWKRANLKRNPHI